MTIKKLDKGTPPDLLYGTAKEALWDQVFKNG
jgi:hypothetical protein